MISKTLPLALLCIPHPERPAFQRGPVLITRPGYLRQRYTRPGKTGRRSGRRVAMPGKEEDDLVKGLAEFQR
jgi:hypothetical protein